MLCTGGTRMREDGPGWGGGDLRLGLMELTEGAEESMGEGVMLATPEIPLCRLMPSISSVMFPAGGVQLGHQAHRTRP